MCSNLDARGIVPWAGTKRHNDGVFGRGGQQCPICPAEFQAGTASGRKTDCGGCCGVLA
jgi:hypothetical protein